MSDQLHAAGASERLDRDAPVPLHAQVSEQIRARILSAEWPPHYRLRSEPELATELGISRGTLRRALSTLIRDGLLVQVRGRGTFVTSTAIEPSIAQKLTTLSEDFARQGVTVTTQVISREVMPAPSPVAALLDLRPGQSVLRLARLRSITAGPVAWLVNYVRVDLAPGLEHADLADRSLFGLLENDYGLKISTGRRTFTATAASGRTAAALEVPENFPLLYLEQITYLDDGRPIEYSDVWIHSERMRVTSLLSRR
ncbi:MULTISPECIES: GntR family transcriptional regulator [unclassified Micromonospora]|uniref:GntR family transcriptional regulator n=1 Tax=unclassified Micromonospora TaxID=2617518 RepID=UPI0022B5FB6B|nr:MULTISPECIES: GntR family transcriptional regulator [unclassified Micromonospora]MCZ7418449.1 GntR family transcriptional regulator [Verrucosispora sp. WMMA2121]WBB92174.1 GntR family transcriptional regulator [Verrucosispora sp. WMMC514]